MMKVMLVDNEAVIRKGLAHCIRWEAFDLMVAAQAGDGIEALEQIPHVRPDIVISDIKMPGMDGLALAEAISRLYPHIKVIILTGFPDFEYAQRAISYRVVDFVLKPTSVEDLTAALDKARQQILEEQSQKTLKHAFENISEQNLSLQRSMLLYDMMQAPALSYLYIINRLAQLGLNLNSYVVLRIAVVPSAEEETEDPSHFLEQAQRIISESLHHLSHHFVPRGVDMCYCVVLTDQLHLLSALCAEAAGAAASIPRFALCVGISRHHTDPFDLPKAGEEAGQAQQFASYFSEQPVMLFDDMPKLTEQVLRQTTHYLKLLKSAMEHNNFSATQETLDDLFEYIHESRFPAEELRTICTYIYNFCISLLFQYDPENSLQTGSLLTLDQLLEGQSIEAIAQKMSAFTRRILKRTTQASSNLDDLMQVVQTYVDNHYMDDISLESLAGIVHLSPSYLSKLFKRRTGINVSAYVQNVRIQKAQILLKTTALKTYEIAERVGIPDPVYFSRIFKKISGMKPKEYRHAGSA